jgi:mRNA export factor
MSTFGNSSVASSSSSRSTSITPNDYSVPHAGNEGISSLNWSPTANILVSSNWDAGIRCWEVQEQGGQVQANPKAQVNHDGSSPVLDTCFSADGNTVFSCGGDKAVRMWQLGSAPPNNIPQQIGAHDAPVQGVGFLRATNIVVSGGWDRKLKFWDCRQPTPVATLDMPERVYAMDVRDNLLVVATAGRHIICYDVSGQPREYLRKESPLKYQTRCIACFPDQMGFAVGSIEGRVGIHYVQKVAGRDSFAFKCHRQDSNAYSVNCIAFQKQFGTFATVGSDGIVNFWDKDNKQRLKGFNAIQRTISCAAFNEQGNLFAYASSYDWSQGSMHLQPGNEIFIHNVAEDEIRPKGKKASYKR